MNLRRLAVRLVSTVAVASGWTARVHRRRHRQGDFRIHILEYHGVEDGPEREGVVSTQRFRQHLRFLKDRYRTVTVEEAARRLASGHLDGDLLVLTFDDGYRDNHRCAWPVLQEQGMTGTIYLTTGFLDGHPLWFDTARRSFEALARQGPLPDSVQQALHAALDEIPPPGQEVNRLKYASAEDRLRVTELVDEAATDLPRREVAQPMSWDEARELRDGGVELGAHTVRHPILSRLSREEQHREIVGSRDRLAEELGASPATFAMPNGSRRDFDDHTLQVLRDLDFLAACTTVRGSNTVGCELHTLRRVGIGSDTSRVLAARLAGLFDEGLRKMWRRRV